MSRSLLLFRSSFLLFAVVFGSRGGTCQIEAGPYTAHILPGGPELRKVLPKTLQRNGRGWHAALWLKTSAPVNAPQAVAGVGGGSSAKDMSFIVGPGSVAFGGSDGSRLAASTAVDWQTWHQVVVSGSGSHGKLFLDGELLIEGSLPDLSTATVLVMGPESADTQKAARFGGWIGGLTFGGEEVSADQVDVSYRHRPDFAARMAEENAKPWPLQTHQQVGYTEPQAPELMPHGSPATAPGAAKTVSPLPALEPMPHNEWRLANQWQLLSNEDHKLKPEDGTRLSQPGYHEGIWYPATVPGTVLTTLIDRGIYPDPYYGLNNLAIPESLSQHDWWYRVEFDTPKDTAQGQHFSLHFAGTNYVADVWLNGQKLGSIYGAFRRGDFDVTSLLKASGVNVLAVRINPPFHPGIPQEQSILGGPGENGGAMVTDGPTFVATEGWDWIPAIRDRNIGLWQDVTLREEGEVTLGDAQVITRLPLPRTDTADIEIHVPLHNSAAHAIHTTVKVEFEGVALPVEASAQSGDTTLVLTSAKYPQLHVSHPRLWWPNGYGKPELYHLKLSAQVAGKSSSVKETAFGIREVSYELSLFDHSGAVRRLEAVPTESLAVGRNPVDVRHEAMRKTLWGWASSTEPDLEKTPALRPVMDKPKLTDLVIKVNGVRIAARGGNWGMDDARKRVDRKRLEPYFRLHRDANLNIIRNWVGQDTEETFFQLADEYGLMVWNDFWASTQDYNAEPGDAQLFLDNARDTVRRYRNHPSIVIWCGRNEGVPPPVINKGLIDVIAQEDGTRFYSPSSNRVNLRDSGPYSWQEPSLYFSKLNRGFSVELGISSFPTKEAFDAMIAPEDRWPVSDAWAYHDWHQKGGGDTHVLMDQLAERYGKAASLDEFERQIQLFNYVDHRAIFEGFYQHLWTPNSGRMLWMTQPAWPSTMWQICSSDYDTQASYYGVKKANEPLHAQMDLSDGTIAAVNTTLQNAAAMKVNAEVYSPSNELLFKRDVVTAAASNETTPLFQLPLTDLFAKSQLLFVRLRWNEKSGTAGSNFYWIGAKPSSYQAMNTLAPAMVEARVVHGLGATNGTVRVALRNSGKIAAIEIKLTLLTQAGERILPAYYSDNYISLLPGEQQEIEITAPESTALAAVRITLRGWNVKPQEVVNQ